MIPPTSMHTVAPNAATVPRLLEFAPACKQLALILLGIYAVSFSVTWYNVWWDSLIGLLVSAAGYYILHDPNAELNPKHATLYYYGTIVTMVSHAVALGVVIFYIIKVYVHNDILGWEVVRVNDPGVALFVFLILFLVVEMIVNSYAIQRALNLTAELLRNEFFARGGVSRV